MTGGGTGSARGRGKSGRRGAVVRLRGRQHDQGSATVEFTLVTVALFIPLVYIVLAVFTVQRAAFGVTEAARQAGRAFVTSSSSAAAPGRAVAAAHLAMADQGLALGAEGVRLSCSAAPCLSPGAWVTVDVDTTVALPVLPSRLVGRPLASIHVHARHVEPVDVARERR